MGQEEGAKERQKVFAGYQINDKVMAVAQNQVQWFSTACRHTAEKKLPQRCSRNTRMKSLRKREKPSARTEGAVMVTLMGRIPAKMGMPKRTLLKKKRPLQAAFCRTALGPPELPTGGLFTPLSINFRRDTGAADVIPISF